MKNFKIHFAEQHREAVLGIITRSNDVVINQLEPQGIAITIQLDDDQADAAYESMCREVDEMVSRRRLDASGTDPVDSQHLHDYPNRSELR